MVDIINLESELKISFQKLAKFAAAGDVFNFNAKLMYARGCAELLHKSIEEPLGEFIFLCYRNAASACLKLSRDVSNPMKSRDYIRQARVYGDHIGYDISQELDEIHGHNLSL